jgi:hypothetical protein
MLNLICWCPPTQQPINLQIYNYTTLARIWSKLIRFHCIMTHSNFRIAPVFS